MKTVQTLTDLFRGHRVYSATAGSNIGHSWLVKDTSAAGTPTYASVDGAGGGVTLTHDNTNEAQVVTLYHGDKEMWDIDDIIEFTWRVKMGQAAVNAATTLVFGLAAAQNDTADSIAENVWFRVQGSASTTLVVCETDDGTTDNDDKATGRTLINAYKTFKVSFALGKSDIRFFIDGEPVALGTTFSMAAATGALQPFVQFQKSAATSVDAVTLNLFQIKWRDND